MGITDLDNHIICHLIWTLCLYICIPHLWGGPSHIFGLLWGLRFVNKKIYCPKFINCRKVVSCNQCQSVNFEYVGRLNVLYFKMSLPGSLHPSLHCLNAARGGLTSDMCDVCLFTSFFSLQIFSKEWFYCSYTERGDVGAEWELVKRLLHTHIFSRGVVHRVETDGASLK